MLTLCAYCSNVLRGLHHIANPCQHHHGKAEAENMDALHYARLVRRYNLYARRHEAVAFHALSIPRWLH
jgi:hypothetical protein